MLKTILNEPSHFFSLSLSTVIVLLSQMTLIEFHGRGLFSLAARSTSCYPGRMVSIQAV